MIRVTSNRGGPAAVAAMLTGKTRTLTGRSLTLPTSKWYVSNAMTATTAILNKPCASVGLSKRAAETLTVRLKPANPRLLVGGDPQKVALVGSPKPKPLELRQLAEMAGSKPSLVLAFLSGPCLAARFRVA